RSDSSAHETDAPNSGACTGWLRLPPNLQGGIDALLYALRGLAFRELDHRFRGLKLHAGVFLAVDQRAQTLDSPRQQGRQPLLSFLLYLWRSAAVIAADRATRNG